MKLIKKVFGKLKQFKLRFLVLVALAVMAMTAAAVFFLFRGEGKEEVVVNYNAFEIGREQVKSIGEISGQEWDSMEYTVEGTTEKSKYVYEDVSNASADVEKYAEYLKNECGFMPMMKFDPSNPAGYLTYGKQSIDEGYVLKIDIDYTPEDYTIYTSKSESTEQIPTSDPNDNGGVTRESIISYLNGFDPSVLELPKSIEEYVTIFDVGRTVINDVYCYGVNVYEKSADGKSNWAVGKFYVPVTLDSIFRYDVATDSYTQIKVISKHQEAVEEEPAEEPEEVDTSNMTKEELKAYKKEQKAAAKEQAKKDKELEKANKAAQKEQEKKEKASKKAAEKAAKEAEKAQKAAEKAEKAKQEADDAAAATDTSEE